MAQLNQSLSDSVFHSSASSSTKPWVEKYRPRTLDEVEAQKEVISTLRSCLRAGSNMPHLLFWGPSGTGKTSTILALAHDLFGPDFIKVRVREMNASDDRGIQVVREKIKTFAQGAVRVVKELKVQSDGKVYPVPSFKLIILDEADALLPDAQAALRRMMEDFSDVTRFCIICNYVTKIIDPIASRCAKFRFKPLMNNTLHQRLRYITAKEGLIVSDEQLSQLYDFSQGDLRQAIVYLQSAGALTPPNGDLSSINLVNVIGEVPVEELERYISALISGNFDRILDVTMELVRAGFAASLLVRQVHCFLVSEQCKLSTVQRAALSLKLAEVEKRLLLKGDDAIQLLDLGGSFSVVCQRS